MIDPRLALAIFGLSILVGAWAYAGVLAIYLRGRR